MTLYNCPEWLTSDYLKHLLHYDPLTGVWTWINPLPHSKMRPGGQYLGSFDTFEEATQVRDQALEAWAGPFAIKPSEREAS